MLRSRPLQAIATFTAAAGVGAFVLARRLRRAASRAKPARAPASVAAVSYSSKPAASSADIPASNLLDFLLVVGNLKRTKRTGWIGRVEGPESIADHMYRMGLLGMVVRDSSLDYTRLVKIAIVHDLAEALVGDITPSSGMSKQEKHALERKAMLSMQATLSESAVGKELVELFDEYESGSTPEAKMVKQFDKLEMIIQAYEYESDQKLFPKLQMFYDSTEGAFSHPQIKEIVAELMRRRALLKK